MNTIDLSPELQSTVDGAENTLATIKAWRVNTPDECQRLVDHLRVIKQAAKTLDEKRLEITRRLDAAKKDIMDFFAVPIDKLKACETAGKIEIERWNAEQRRIAAEAERERRRLEDEERERQATIQRETEALLAKAEQTDDPAEAERLEEQAIRIQATAAPMPIMMPSIELVKVKGSSETVRWYARIVDPGLVPREFCVPNQSGLDAYAQATKGAAKVAGCEMYSKTTIGIR